MAQDNTPNFIRPGMTGDADPANRTKQRESSVGEAFTDDDADAEVPARAEDKKRAGNPLETELTTHEALEPGLQAHREPGQ